MFRSLSLTVALSAVSLGGALACQPTPETQQLKREVVAKYEAGQREAGHRLLSRFGYASTWAAHEQVTVTAVFDSRERGMTLFAERKPGVSSSGDMLIAIPPGTRFIPQTKGGEAPQELILARGAVMLMGSLHTTETTAVPVLCTTYRRHGPEAGVRYTLRMAEPGSALDEVAQAVCSGTRAPQASEAALAVWIASGSAPTPAQLGSSSYRTFHTPRQPVNRSHVAGAKRILLQAGLDLKDFAFFGQLTPQSMDSGEPSQGTQDGRAVDPEPTPAPAPTPTGASPQSSPRSGEFAG
ncbi:MAG: hypothetical protein KDD82_16495 [Planctomycetes bacterium]|nr:hypothetical protein [Planctomycetota bacterium]